jgi:type II secretory pathway pseudopilin PulG
MKIRNKKAQVWVETVIYTLIALAIIALVLAFVKPKIEEYKDKVIIESAMDGMRILKNAIDESSITAGNVRIVEFSLKKGTLSVDPENATIEYLLDKSSFSYTEPGEVIDRGGLKVLTKDEKGKKIFVWLQLGGINLTYNEKVKKEALQATPSPYKLRVENKGKEEAGERVRMDISVI